VKKKLFPSGENEIIPAIHTPEHLVLKFH
jgi:hypothetical protein